MSEKIVCVRLSARYVRFIDALVESGEFRSRSDVIRHAISVMMASEQRQQRP
jgi:putative addiction module CopG family antidote